MESGVALIPASFYQPKNAYKFMLKRTKDMGVIDFIKDLYIYNLALGNLFSDCGKNMYGYKFTGTLVLLI